MIVLTTFIFCIMSNIMLFTFMSHIMGVTSSAYCTNKILKSSYILECPNHLKSLTMTTIPMFSDSLSEAAKKEDLQWMHYAAFVLEDCLSSL